MFRCWAGRPTDRPTFNKLVRELTYMLDDESVSTDKYHYFQNLKQFSNFNVIPFYRVNVDEEDWPSVQINESFSEMILIIVLELFYVTLFQWLNARYRYGILGVL